MSFLPIGMKKIHSKMKSLARPKHFSHYKYMGIFPDAQGLVTPQSMIGSYRISNSYETLWFSSLPARMKKIRSKMKALEWPKDYMSIFQMLKGRYLHRQWWDLAKCELIQAFMHVLVTCKNDEDQIKKECARVPQRFSHYKSMDIFQVAQWQLTMQSVIGSGRNSKSSEMLY